MGCETKKDRKELENLKSLLAKNPSNIKLLLKIGMLLFDPFIEIDLAIPYFKKAVKLSPNNLNVLFWTGYILYHGMWKYSEAKKLFERALSIDPNRAEFHYMMFYVLWHMTKNEMTGLHNLLKAIELQPKWLDPKIQYIVYLIGKNKFEKAKNELSIAYSLLEERYKNKKIKGINILEQYYLDNSGGVDYEFTKRMLDEKKKRLEQELKNPNLHSKT